MVIKIVVNLFFFFCEQSSVEQFFLNVLRKEKNMNVTEIDRLRRN